MSQHRLTATQVAVVSFGGALGAVARWGLTTWAPVGTGFPWSTFAINVTGSLLLALLPAWAMIRRHHLLALFLGTGALGGFTTLSAYGEETRALLADGAVAVAAAYVLGTLVVAVASVQVAHQWVTPPEQQQFHDEDADL